MLQKIPVSFINVLCFKNLCINLFFSVAFIAGILHGIANKLILCSQHLKQYLYFYLIQQNLHNTKQPFHFLIFLKFLEWFSFCNVLDFIFYFYFYFYKIRNLCLFCQFKYYRFYALYFRARLNRVFTE